MEFSLCCKFHKEKIAYKIYTLTNIKTLSKEKAREKIYSVVLNNIDSLQLSFDYCKNNGIKGFRLASDIIPHHTNLLDLGFLEKTDLDFFREKLQNLNPYDLILSMHPGQFVNMGSPNPEVIKSSVRELKEHLFIANSIGFGDINFHLGGTYGDKIAAMKNFITNMRLEFTPEELSKFTLENDEFNYSINEVVEVCHELSIPAVFDIHHQRVYNNKFGLSHDTLEEEFLLARETWKGRKWQRLHISSPKNGFENIKDSRAHADFIDVQHLPKFLFSYDNLIIDVEAKAKEVAVLRLYEEIKNYE